MAKRISKSVQSNLPPEGIPPMASPIEGLPPEGIVPPEGIPEMSSMMPDNSGQMTPEQMATDLKTKLADIENQKRSINSKNITRNNDLGRYREMLIKELFAILQKAGVDPSNLESIRNFLVQLEKTNPDLAELFQFVFDGLMDESSNTMEPKLDTRRNQSKNSGLMNRFGNLGEQVVRNGTLPDSVEPEEGMLQPPIEEMPVENVPPEETVPPAMA